MVKEINYASTGGNFVLYYFSGDFILLNVNFEISMFIRFNINFLWTAFI